MPTYSMLYYGIHDHHTMSSWPVYIEIMVSNWINDPVIWNVSNQKDQASLRSHAPKKSVPCRCIINNSIQPPHPLFTCKKTLKNSTINLNNGHSYCWYSHLSSLHVSIGKCRLHSLCHFCGTSSLIALAIYQPSLVESSAFDLLIAVGMFNTYNNKNASKIHTLPSL